MLTDLTELLAPSGTWLQNAQALRKARGAPAHFGFSSPREVQQATAQHLGVTYEATRQWLRALDTYEFLKNNELEIDLERAGPAKLALAHRAIHKAHMPREQLRALLLDRTCSRARLQAAIRAFEARSSSVAKRFEKDVEDAIWEHPGALGLDSPLAEEEQPPDRLVQADLLILDGNGKIAAVEARRRIPEEKVREQLLQRMALLKLKYAFVWLVVPSSESERAEAFVTLLERLGLQGIGVALLHPREAGGQLETLCC